MQSPPDDRGMTIPGLDPDKLLDCVHCGLCLSVCPTYEITGDENHSPRGRIYLMRGLSEGRTDLNATVVHDLDTCLGCRACETICPSAVHYGEMLTAVRGEIERTHDRSGPEKRKRRLLLDLLTNPGKLAPAVWAAGLTGKLFGPGGGPVAMVNRFLFGPSAPSLPLPEEASPRVETLPEFTPARGERRARVALLAGCVMQVLFQRINRATVEVLAANGCDVVIPRSAGCCGAFHMHNGFLDGARSRAERLIPVLEAAEVDAIIINSAGCGSSMKEYPELFHGDEAWSERARGIALKSRDICEYLSEIGPREAPRKLPLRVAYHDACHLAHAQGIRTQPRALLQSIAGVELVPFSDPDWCCGSAGIYNFLQPEMAAELQSRKVNTLLAADPQAVATGNPGCHAWIEGGLRAAGSDIGVKHTVELLAEAYAEPAPVSGG